MVWITNRIKIWKFDRSKVDSIELFFQLGIFLRTKISKGKGMLLLLNRNFLWIYKSDEFYTENPRRYTIGEKHWMWIMFW
jgi:hypothetical protein